MGESVQENTSMHGNCANHGQIEKLVISNNAIVASLAGQMKVLLLVLGGCALIVTTVITAAIADSIKMHNIATTTISGVSSNRKEIKTIKVDLDKHEVRLNCIEKNIRE